MKLVEKAYQWVEETVMSRLSNLAVWQSVAKEALLDAGVGPDNGLSVNDMIRTKVSGPTFDELGRRHEAVELLNRANFKNLRVSVHATVERTIFCSNAASKSLYFLE